LYVFIHDKFNNLLRVGYENNKHDCRHRYCLLIFSLRQNLLSPVYDVINKSKVKTSKKPNPSVEDIQR